jgi:hypothetical protein
LPGKHELKRNPSARFLSPEVEINSLENHGRNGIGKKISNIVYNWGGRIVEDGSLDQGGFEINVAPAGGDLFIRQMEEIFDVLNEGGAEVGENCGMHVHIDARDFTPFDIRRLIMYYYLIEPVLFAMVPKERRNNTYCVPCGERLRKGVTKPAKTSREVRYNLFKAVYGGRFRGNIGPAIVKDKKGNPKLTDNGNYITKQNVINGDKSFQDLKKNKNGASRYNALNLVSWFFRGSVECRLYPGTTSFSDATNWSMMWACILDYVAKSSDSEINRLDPDLKRTALFKSLAGRDKLQEFVDNSIKNHGGNPDHYDTAPAQPKDTVPEEGYGTSPAMRFLRDIRQGNITLSYNERDMRPTCDCDSCMERYAIRILELRRLEAAASATRYQFLVSDTSDIILDDFDL